MVILAVQPLMAKSSSISDKMVGLTLIQPQTTPQSHHQLTVSQLIHMVLKILPRTHMASLLMTPTSSTHHTAALMEAQMDTICMDLPLTAATMSMDNLPKIPMTFMVPMETVMLMPLMELEAMTSMEQMEKILPMDLTDLMVIFMDPMEVIMHLMDLLVIFMDHTEETMHRMDKMVIFMDHTEETMHRMDKMVICMDLTVVTMVRMEQVATTCMDLLKVIMPPMDQMAMTCTDRLQELMFMDHTTAMESTQMSIAILPKDQLNMANKETL